MPDMETPRMVQPALGPAPEHKPHRGIVEARRRSRRPSLLPLAARGEPIRISMYQNPGPPYMATSGPPLRVCVFLFSSLRGGLFLFSLPG